MIGVGGRWKVYTDPPGMEWRGASPAHPPDPAPGTMYWNTTDQHLYLWVPYKASFLEIFTAEVWDAVDSLPKGSWLQLVQATR